MNEISAFELNLLGGVIESDNPYDILDQFVLTLQGYNKILLLT